MREMREPGGEMSSSNRMMGALPTRFRAVSEKLRHSVFAICLSLFLGGCDLPRGEGGPSQEHDTMEVDRTAASRSIVCGIDRSGSYQFLEVGRELCARILADPRESRPGDTVLIRWISDRSYDGTEFIDRMGLPADTAEACSRNLLDGRCRRLRSVFEAGLTAVRRAHVQHLLSRNPASANRTDIMGFLQVAADEFAMARSGKELRLYMATDLEDNLHYDVEPDLEGVSVVVFALETGPDPERAIRLQQDWRKRLEGFGVTEVTFRSVEVNR